jgi:hypothetical protein
MLIKLEFYGQILVKSSNIKFNKIRVEGSELFHAGGRMDRQTDRQTDRQDKTNIAFRNFANVPENQTIVLLTAK